MKYKISYWFEWGGPCFWSADMPTRECFGYPIEPDQLPLQLATIQRIEALIRWHDQSLNQDYPPDPGPWDQEEYNHFLHVARELLAIIRKELGEGYEILEQL